MSSSDEFKDCEEPDEFFDQPAEEELEEEKEPDSYGNSNNGFKEEEENGAPFK
jgi:hypothetical protein